VPRGARADESRELRREMPEAVPARHSVEQVGGAGSRGGGGVWESGERAAVSGEGGGDGGGRGEAWRHGDDEMEEEMRWDRSKRAPSPGELCASIFTASERARAQKGVSVRVR
jgi:hypothetical protein